MKTAKIETYASLIRECASLLDQRNWGQALLHGTRLPQMQVAFASKLCSFLMPSHCGVIDSVIADQYPRLDFSLDKDGFVRTNRLNATKYFEFCEGLQLLAGQLNEKGNAFAWTDRDGKQHAWRAVDVERALYG